MKDELRVHRITFGALAFLLIAFVLFLMRLRPSLANQRLEAAADLAIVIVAATVFTFMGMLEGAMAFQFGRPHKRERLSYLLLGILSLACGLFLAISGSSSMQTVALVAAPHAFLFGIAQLRLSQHLEHHPAYKRALTVCGVIELLLGLTMLITSQRLSSEGAAILLGYVAIISLLQLLPLVLYLRSRAPSRV